MRDKHDRDGYEKRGQSDEGSQSPPGTFSNSGGKANRAEDKSQQRNKGETHGADNGSKRLSGPGRAKCQQNNQGKSDADADAELDENRDALANALGYFFRRKCRHCVEWLVQPE
jgi:hypothetical protein